MRDSMYRCTRASCSQDRMRLSAMLPVLKDGVLFAAGGVVSRDVRHSPLPAEQIAPLSVDVQRLSH